MRDVALSLILLAAPATAAQDAVHALPYPGRVPQTHALELTLGGAEGEALTVRVASAPGWLAFVLDADAPEPDGATEPVGRLAFEVVPGAPVGETGRVEVAVVDERGGERARHVVRVRVSAPELALSAPWPNPSRGGAAVAFTLADAGAVRLSVLDALGREVAVLADGDLPAGGHERRLRAGALAAGLYAVRLVTGTDDRVRRLTVVR